MSNSIISSNHKNKVPKNTCKICKNLFYSRLSKSSVCKSKECRSIALRIAYKENKVDCTCSVCGIEYKATQKQSKTKCPKCVRPDKYVYKERYEKTVFCKHCGEIVRVEIKNKMAKEVNFTTYSGVCDSCKKENFKKSSERMKLNNPAYSKSLTTKEYGEKQKRKSEIKAYKEKMKWTHSLEFRKRTSERMKINNPMKNPETVRKSVNTLKRNIENGTTKFKRGYERKGFKGTRTINRYLRFCTFDWRDVLLKKANFSCQRCGTTNCNLNVHHTTPFRTIISNFSESLGINMSTIVYADSDFLRLEKEIKNFHMEQLDNIGIVVCESCHSDLDSKYKRRKIKDKI